MKCMSDSCSTDLPKDSKVELCDDCLEQMANHYEQLLLFDLQNSQEERQIANQLIDDWIRDFA